MKKVKALVITGYGINCEKEMSLACEIAGAEVTSKHAQHMFCSDFPWNEFQLIMFPGGFSFGDELGAAKAFANRITYHAMHLRDNLQAFVNRGNCILGICNGFQLLVKLGLLPGNGNFDQTVSLANNHSSRFECRWVHHKINPSNCVFTKGIEALYLPSRHGEGNFVSTPEMISKLFNSKQVVLQYSNEDGSVATMFPANPNGSARAIAGICDPTGRIFGMMAHPEAAIHFTNDPRWTRMKEQLLRSNKPLPTYGASLKIFQNVVNYLREQR